MTDTLSRQRIAELCNDSPARRAFWKGKKVFITGATGMLGSWLTHSLVEYGATVTILVRDSVPASLFFNDDTSKRVNQVYGSFTDYALVRRAFMEYEPEFVFHVGAQTQVRTANRHPRETFEVNIGGTWNVLDAARQTPTIKGVLIASSDKAYGPQPVLPYHEDASMNGEHPYDVSKSCTDLLARSYHKTFGTPICVTRCGNLYGPGDKNFDRIIPGTIRSVIFGERPVIRSDGKFIRDYFFVPDAVDGYLTIAENIHRPEIVGEAFNLSTGNRLDVIALFKKILKIMGADAEPIILNQASNEIREQSLSSEKAEQVLGWRARHSVDEGLQLTIAWYEELLANQHGA